MEPYYVYILRCRGGSLYTGMTNDMAHRLTLHRSGRGAKYTRSYPPQELAALWLCADKTAAARLEYAIKSSLTHAQKESLADTPQTVSTLFPQVGEVEVCSVEAYNALLSS